MVVPLIVSGLSFSSASVMGWKTDTHPTLVDLAMNVLEDDNYTYLVSHLIDSGYLTRIKKAVTNCDRIDLAINHYYNPITDQGLAGATSAETIAQTFFDQALETYESGDAGTAWYYFGWSLHVVQDLMVPFHSHLDPLNGHTDYETFVHEYRFYYPMPENGTYNVAPDASGWLVYAASTSYPYYDAISGANATEANFDTVAEILFPEAVALTAGYIKFFADAIGMGDFNVYAIHEGLNYVKVGWDEVLDQDFISYEVYVSTDKEDLYSEEPYAVIEDRGTTEKTIVHLDLGTNYYVAIKAISANLSHHSNLLKVSPHWPLLFFAVPGITSLVAIFILLSNRHRQHRRRRS